MEWAFAYFTWQRGSRVILEVPREPETLARPSAIGAAVRLEEEVPRANGPFAPSARSRLALHP